MQQTRYGTFATVLIWATALTFVALLAHPAAGGGHHTGSHDALKAVYAARTHLGFMHGAVLGLQLAVLTCILAFCALLGFEHPLVAFAAVAFTAAAAAICVAGSLDGFLIPAFAAPALSLNGSPLDMGPPIAAGAIVIQYATKAAILLMAISVTCLSLQMLAARVLRGVAIGGIGLALLQIGALAVLPVLTPHNVAFSALPVLIWQVVLGAAWQKGGGGGLRLADA